MRAEVEMIKSIGEHIGYGHLMAIASALWREDLRNKDYPESGAFVGVCPSQVIDDLQESIKREIKQYNDYIKS